MNIFYLNKSKVLHINDLRGNYLIDKPYLAPSATTYILVADSTKMPTSL